ncbi:tetratricopeptide repeat protein [Raineya orbicola]|uniref:Tetratricopeptide repeat n=1 Tax=Raineya orbicola TaxID=2016530 RepID=A0A2N3IID8_9BACT|nr:tetratricopeptide repeat protein [Raineya orbicola]PKQ70018.1 Tetratricopeptide repeat [Raineya orbicola]
MRYWLLILFLQNVYLLSAQNDIALLVQKTYQIRSDSNLVKTYQDIGKIYLDEKKLNDSASFYFQKSLDLARKIKFLSGEARSFELLALSQEAQGKYAKALELYNQSAILYGKMGNKKAQAISLNMAGIMCDYLGRFDEALKYLFQAAKIKEEINNLLGLSNTYNDIGIIYEQLKEGDKAIEYYQKSLEILEKNGGKPHSIANIYNNIGVVFYDQHKYDEALQYFQKSMAIREKINSNNLLSSIFNIANIHYARKNYTEALKLYLKALDIAQEQKRNEFISQYHLAVAFTQIALADYDNARKHIEEGLKIAQEFQFKMNEMEAYEAMVKLDSAQKNYESAFKNARKLAKLEVEMFKKEKSEQIARYQTLYETERKENENRLLRQMQTAQMTENRLLRAESERKAMENELLRQEQEMKELENKRLAELQNFTKKENLLLKESEKLKAAENEKLRIQNERDKQKLHLQVIISISSIVLIILFSALLLALFYAHRKKIIAYRLLQEVNQEVSLQREEILTQAETLKEYNEQMKLQNLELSQAYAHIRDSILYAERLQNAVISQEQDLTELVGECFVLNLPRDIISGDFLWTAQHEQYKWIAVADCTGHGVPGSMMTFLGISALNQIVMERKIFEPAQILNELDKFIIQFLNKSGKENGNIPQSDGMDISLICIDTKKQILQFSGAKNPLYVCQNGNLQIVPAGMFSLGFNIFQENKNFTQYETTLPQKTTLFLCTDGFQDQFGGNAEKPKKFMNKNLKETFMLVAELPLQEQKRELLKKFMDWKGNFPQTDDVLVVGMRL